MSAVDPGVRDARTRPGGRLPQDDDVEDAAPNTTELATPSTAHHGLEQTVMPSPTIVSLAPSPRELHQTRLAYLQPLASELYQANSRLGPWERDALPDPDDETAVRRWMLESRRDHDPDVVDGSRAPAPLRAFADLPAPLDRLFAVIAHEGEDAGFLFPVDLHVLLEGWIWLLPPGGGRLVAERRLRPERRDALVGAVADQHRDALESADLVLAFSTVPWRLQVLHGERGYRRALMETGIAVSRVCGVAGAAGLRPDAVVDFVETTVDDCLFNDGIERFCTALVPLRLTAEDDAAAAVPDATPNGAPAVRPGGAPAPGSDAATARGQNGRTA